MKPTQFKIVLDEISLIVINKKKKLKRTVDRDRKYVSIYLECTKTDVGKKKTHNGFPINILVSSIEQDPFLIT